MRGIPRSLLSAVLLLSSASAVAQDAGVTASETLLLRAGQLVDVKAGKVLADQGILVSGERIVAVGPWDSLRGRPAARVLDLALDPFRSSPRSHRLIGRASCASRSTSRSPPCYAAAPGEPILSEESGTYADPAAPVKLHDVGFNHGLGSVVSALLAEGLVLERLVELDWSPYDIFPDMEEAAPGRFRMRRFGRSRAP